MPLRTNFSRFKEPRGFIKILQFVIAIFAFATTAGYYSEFKIRVSKHCPTNATTNATKNGTYEKLFKFSYPLGEMEYYGGSLPCRKRSHGTQNLDSNFKSESQFFVFVGVISFLYSIVAMVFYVSFEDPAKYGPGGSGRAMQSFATVDFFVTMLLALFWFAGSIAWATGLTSLKDKTDADDYIKKATECSNDNCEVLKKAGYAALTISVLFGFLNCFLWCANIWFVYKETVWHKEPVETASADQTTGDIPRQQVPEETIP